uniref:Uncharacterized protein n=1 Tax=Globodera rostochiensis TaxID=31243 RepID=A0A914H8F1_GLORO
MDFLEDGDMPPILDGPFSPARDAEALMEEAPPLGEVLERLPHEDLVAPAQPKAAARSQLKEPFANMNLDVAQFDGDQWMCLAAAQASTGRFK